MNKFLAVVKREYIQRVRSKLFAVMTVLGPVMLVVFTVVPGLLITKTGSRSRIAIIDQTSGARLTGPLERALTEGQGESDNGAPDIGETLPSTPGVRAARAANSIGETFAVESVPINGRSLDEVRQQLNVRIGRNELDGYLVIPADILVDYKVRATYYGRNVSDFFTAKQLEKYLNRVVGRLRLVDAGVREERIDELSKPVSLASIPVNAKGEEGTEDKGFGFGVVFGTGFAIYLTILLYGQVVLGAVIEEKETRIAEILFSSVRSFQLLFGKLIGVSLVALTQLGIWLLAFALLSGAGIAWLAANGVTGIGRLSLPPIFFISFFLFFLFGYFLYATFYALVGSMVTTTQEGGQVAMPIIFLLVAAIYMAFPVMRNPNSAFSFWVSLIPFFAPITMMVRIVTQTPPLWQIVLSLGFGLVTVTVVLWLASRIYCVGMLMYGKKATIPEAWRWVWQQ